MKSVDDSDGPHDDRPLDPADDSTSGIEPNATLNEPSSSTARELLRSYFDRKSQTPATSEPSSQPLAPQRKSAPAERPKPRRFAIRLRWRSWRELIRRQCVRHAPVILAVALVLSVSLTGWHWYQSRFPHGLIETLPTATRGLTCVAFGGDGRWMATGSGTGEVSVWDRQRGQPGKIRSSSGLPITAVRFTNDQFLIASGLGKRLQVWSLKNFEAKEIPLLPAPITGFAVHPRRPEIVIGLQNGELSVLNSASGAVQQMASGHKGWARVMEFHPGGSWFVTGGADGQLIVRDGKSHKRTKSWDAHATDVSSLAISSDGLTLASADWSGNVRLWKMPEGELVRDLPHANGVSSVVFHNARWITASWDGRIRVWSHPDGREIGHVETHEPITALALAPDGRRAATVSPSTAVRIWQIP
jgi:WD40 repeat protein